MLEHVDGQRSIEAGVLQRQSLLTVTHDGLDSRVGALDDLSHLAAKLDRPIILVVIGLECQVLAKARPDLERLGSGQPAAGGVPVVEALDHRVTVGEDFVPVAHEVVADTLLLGSQLRDRLRP